MNSTNDLSFVEFEVFSTLWIILSPLSMNWMNARTFPTMIIVRNWKHLEFGKASKVNEGKQESKAKSESNWKQLDEV